MATRDGQDDGLGPALAEELEAWLESKPDLRVAVDSNYQLNAEDALTISGHDVVVFVDAAQTGTESFAFRPLPPEKTIAFSTHAHVPPPRCWRCARSSMARVPPPGS